MVTRAQILPVTLLVIDLLAAIIYFYSGDKMRAGYWVSAAAITFFATFGGH